VTEEARLAEAVERLIAVVIRQRSAVPGPEPRQLTTTQALALLTLADEGPLRLGALADRIATTDATASRTVDVLERAGFARRVPDPADGRGISVEPTAEGRREVVRRRRRMAAMVGELLRGLGPDEQSRFVDLLGGLNELLVAAEREPARV
jgi:MarR family transcriptional regulator, organic hydroperoxide resistance regulator